MEPINVNLSCDLQHQVKVQYLDGYFFSKDSAGHKINVDVFNNGVPVSVGGSVSADVIRSDGETVPVTGAVSENRAYVILPQAAYAVVGAEQITIKVTEGTTIVTIASFVVYVHESDTDITVDPGTIIPSIQALISQIETAVASIPADYSSLWTSLAPAFSTSTAYAVGQYVTNSGVLYRFTTAHPAGTWNSAHVTAVNLGSEISALKSAIGASIDYTKSLAENVSAKTLAEWNVNAGFTLGNFNTLGYSDDTTYVKSVVLPAGTYYFPGLTGYKFGAFYYTSDTSGSSGFSNRTAAYTFNASGSFVVRVGKSSGGDLSSSDISAIISGFVITRKNGTNNIETILSGVVNGQQYTISPTFELGNIMVSSGELSFVDNDKRVRTPETGYFMLSVGDTVTFDTEDFNFAYYGVYDDGSAIANSGWLSATITIPKNGKYWLVARYPDDSVITDVNDFTAVITTKNVTNYMKRTDKEIGAIKTSIQGIDAGTNLIKFRFEAHRGYSSVAPQNTLPAFAAAKKAGFEFIETDVRFSSDGYPVLIHDDTVNATSDGTGQVSGKTLAELKALDFGSWFSADFTGTRIPTLEEGLILCKRLGLGVYLELKASNMTSTQYNTVVNAIKAVGMWDNVVIESFHLADLMAVANIDNTANLSFVTNARQLDEHYDANDATINEAMAFFATTLGKYNVISWQAGRFTAEQASTVQSNGVYLETYTVNLTDMETVLIPMSGVLNGVITNDITPASYYEYYLPD